MKQYIKDKMRSPASSSTTRQRATMLAKYKTNMSALERAFWLLENGGSLNDALDN